MLLPTIAMSLFSSEVTRGLIIDTKPIFLSKFLESISPLEKKEENKKRDTAITTEKSFKLKNINKKFLYVVVALVVLIAIYLTK